MYEPINERQSDPRQSLPALRSIGQLVCNYSEGEKVSEGTHKRVLTNRLVRFDSYASVPRQGAWLECGAAVLSRATGTRRAPLEVGEWEKFRASDTLARVEVRKNSKLLKS